MKTSGDAEDADRWKLAVWEEVEDPGGWHRQTELRIGATRNSKVGEIGEEYANFVYWMRELARQPTKVDSHQLSDCVDELVRLTGNLGQPADAEDVDAVLRDAIATQSAAGAPVSALHLARASYLGTISAESPERGQAIDAAVQTAEPDSPDWGAAMIAKCAYEVSVSRYNAAIRTARELLRAVERGLDPIFECGALTHQGTALFTSFQDLKEAERLLLRAVAFAPQARSNVRVARWVATAYHYLGRIAEARGDDANCLSLYLLGKEYQDRCPQELEADAFLQLRLSEPLANANLLELAEDHLDEAASLARTGAHKGSAGVQVDIGYATLEAKKGNLTKAEEDGQKARQRCRDIAFRRGELLCLGFLFTIRCKRRHFLRAGLTLARIVPTLVTGELRRNNLLKLWVNIPVLFRLAFRRVSRAVGKRPAVKTPTGCPCPLHGR
ncbi:hypothetical protein ACQP1P_35660 [Dactylosporangium sp. CA-052675]|uniref:hypothetical protein n=1 Tax=Dactylosporangium sp. CA-052675 TaxID=3239927 RepID=UPI003D92AC3F